MKYPWVIVYLNSVFGFVPAIISIGARTTNSFVIRPVWFFEQMAVFTMGSVDVSGSNTNATKYVYPLRHSFEMIGVYAFTVSAKVINFIFKRYRTNKCLVDNSVRSDDLIFPAPPPYTVTLIIDRTGPLPTRFWVPLVKIFFKTILMGAITPGIITKRIISNTPLVTSPTKTSRLGCRIAQVTAIHFIHCNTLTGLSI